jgi:hypothetical protein
MVVSKETADRFIEQFKNFLLFAYEHYIENSNESDFLEKLVLARNYYAENKDILETYVKTTKDELDLEMIESIKTLRMGTWVYLRDTTKYSIFVNPDISQSFAVLGLTDRIRGIFGTSGIAMKAGIVNIGKVYVCDGLITDLVQLGKNYRSEFNEMHKKNKEKGTFFKQYNA